MTALKLFLILVGVLAWARWVTRARRRDPLHACTLYRVEGCAHVDGFLCDVDTCPMLKEWKERHHG